MITFDEYIIQEGITESQIDQLIEYAQTDTLLHRFTSDKDRFATREHFRNWLKQDSKLFVLTNDAQRLLGIIWIESLPLPEAQYIFDVDRFSYTMTFAIRIYGEARGKKLAHSFLTYVLNIMKHPRLWLKTSFDNVAAIKVYEKAGFHTVSTPDNHGKIVMISHMQQNAL